MCKQCEFIKSVNDTHGRASIPILVDKWLKESEKFDFDPVGDKINCAEYLDNNELCRANLGLELVTQKQKITKSKNAQKEDRRHVKEDVFIDSEPDEDLIASPKKVQKKL